MVRLRGRKKQFQAKLMHARHAISFEADTADDASGRFVFMHDTELGSTSLV